MISIYTADGSIKIFPITVPILGEGSPIFFQSPPAEELSEARWVQGLLPVRYSVTRLNELRELVEADEREKAGPRWFTLLNQAEELAAVPKEESLLTPDHLEALWRRVGVLPYPHQLETARRVIFEMGGRAILADEVGLGKTIEAGIIIKELLLRGMAKKVLILTPASLVWQWYRELKEKFNLAFGMQRSEYDWERTNQLIASLDTAKRSPHREIIEGLHFDVLVVDEAHKLKNEKTQSYRFINSISRTFCLLLTATPVQNDLKELYNLINLIRPGQLGTYRRFKQEFVVDARLPKRTEELKEILAEVMVRHTRGEGGITLTARHVHPVPVELTPPERELYEGVSRFVREGYLSSRGLSHNVLPYLTLQREVCSSPIAAAVTLEKMLNQTAHGEARHLLTRLLEQALQIQENSKATLLEKLIGEINEQVIVFTEYRATQQYLKWRLEKAGYTTFTFDGSLSSSRKEWIRELFRRQGHVLVSTESGGEGLNFQFCANVINYDLPWNPMRLEQRIGRVHRLGQERDVRIYNLTTRATIEEYVLYLLYEKLNMFQMIIGELDAIITHLKLGSSFERELTHILIGSESDEEMRSRLDQLAELILSARERVQQDRFEERLGLW